MNLVKKAAGVMKNTLGINSLKLKKYTPEILIGVGLAMGVAAIVEACVATKKSDGIVEEHNEIRQSIEDVANKETVPAEFDKKKEVFNLYVGTAKEYAKLYFPAAMLAVGSAAFILSGYGVIKKRNLAIISAYNGLKLAYDGLNERLVDELGEERAKELKYGVKTHVVESKEVNEKGKEVTKKEEKKVFQGFDPSTLSPYAKFFDESCSMWQKDPDYNYMFLKAQQNYATQLLNSRGHLFLNEVYDMLGIPRTAAGAAVGWIKGLGDDYVDFGLYNGNRESVRDFINGYERSILLDFNVDGVIWDKIESFRND